MLKEVIDACRLLLNNYPQAEYIKEYLNSRISKQSQDLFEIGYLPKTNELHVLSNLVGEEALTESGIAISKTIENALGPRQLLVSLFENHQIIMPFKNHYNEIVGVVCRTTCSEHELKTLKISKYKNSKESEIFKKGNLLFNLNNAKNHILAKDFVYVVEGQFDCIKMVENGILNVVALGTSNITDYQFNLIMRYTNNIVLLFDNDEAGRSGAKKAVLKYNEYANIEEKYVPEPFKDIDEYLSNNNLIENI